MPSPGEREQRLKEQMAEATKGVTPLSAPAFDDRCKGIRDYLKIMARQVLDLKTDLSAPLGSDKGEMIANIVLAYRHLEDATMRLGKAIQAFDGGKSVYDK